MSEGLVEKIPLQLPPPMHTQTSKNRGRKQDIIPIISKYKEMKREQTFSGHVFTYIYEQQFNLS